MFSCSSPKLNSFFTEKNLKLLFHVTNNKKMDGSSQLTAIFSCICSYKPLWESKDINDVVFALENL